MRKLITVLTCAVLCTACFAACGKKTEEKKGDATATVTPADTNPVKDPEQEAQDREDAATIRIYYDMARGIEIYYPKQFKEAITAAEDGAFSIKSEDATATLNFTIQERTGMKDLEYYTSVFAADYPEGFDFTMLQDGTVLLISGKDKDGIGNILLCRISGDSVIKLQIICPADDIMTWNGRMLTFCDIRVNQMQENFEDEKIVRYTQEGCRKTVETKVKSFMEDISSKITDGNGRASLVNGDLSDFEGLPCYTFQVGVMTDEKFTAEYTFLVSPIGEVYQLDAVSGEYQLYDGK